MEDLYKLVAKKVGISQEQAKEAVDTVIGYLKKNLPAPVAGQIDSLLAGGDVAKMASGLTGQLGGLLKKK